MATLILIEGLPKSGKSSVRDHVANAIGGVGIGESDMPHPIDIGWPADRRAAILGCRLDSYPFDAWEHLVDSLADLDRPLVLEARLCQNAACFAIAAGAAEEEALEISARIISIIERAPPLVLLLQPKDPNEHVGTILDHFDPQSQDYLAELFGSLPYARERGLTGARAFEETVRAWIPVVERTKELLERASGITTASLHDPAADWEATKRSAVEAARLVADPSAESNPG